MQLLIFLCPQSGLRFPGSTTTGAGCVLLVSNMSETETECDHLFILFGVYGDVQVCFARRPSRVKPILTAPLIFLILDSG